MSDRHAARTGRAVIRLAAMVAVLALALGPLALAGNAAGGVTMTARIMLQGHARSGSWAAIEVDLKNDGPRVEGELQMNGGSQGTVKYAMAVKLETGSHQTYVLHAQPPQFGRNVKIDLVDGGNVVSSVQVAYLTHDQNQLVIGVIAERPAGIVSELKLPQNPFGSTPAVVTLGIADLPQRAEGWSSLDRIVWQDVDSNQLSSAQLTSLRQWIAAGGRLVIVGGTAGINTLSAFPDDLLPFRPTATIDLDPSRLVGVLGPLPTGASVLPAMAGAQGAGRALATSGDRVVAADLVYGSGRVTVVGFDPTVKWLAESKTVDQLWRGLLPERFGSGGTSNDDSQLVGAVYQLPALALPPITGLLVILGLYVLIIGPINYLILKRLDRRELAWITMPILVVAFAAASFGYGSFLRGTDVVINEVAIVRGAPDATEATADVYFGIFSPTRNTYQVNVPQGALLAAPLAGDQFGQGVINLDILQGTGTEQPSAVRNLSVGSGSIRVVRAELPVTAPRMKATLNLVDGVLTGTFENASEQPLESVAVVLGSSVAVLGDVEAHGTRNIRIPVQVNPFGSSLADQIIGPSFDTSNAAGILRATRYNMVSQLTYDPNGMSGGGLSADRAVILAFGRDAILDLQVGNESPRRNGNVMYYVPVQIGLTGKVTFQGDLLQSTVIDGLFFQKDRSFISMSSGTATLGYQPIPFEGTLSATEVRLQLGGGGNLAPGATGKPITPLAEIPPPCTDSLNSIPKGCLGPRDDQMPDVEVFDRTTGTWARLPRMDLEATYTLMNPTRYVDAVTGQLLVQFVNNDQNAGMGFGFQVAIAGTVK
ncbi:MAG TPA: hypothetical protein VJ850_12220 [Candidatus Limnocylindrales bacterium]|nr:hypothetical protein [Candidatus Limnocylindrales bacterium]